LYLEDISSPVRHATKKAIITMDDVGKEACLPPLIERAVSLFGKSSFRLPAIRDLSDEERNIAEKIARIKGGASLAEEIGRIAEAFSLDGQARPLILSYPIVEKVIRDHGSLPTENLVISVHDWDYIVRNVSDNPDKINLIKRFFGSGSFLTVGANRIDGYFAVTYFETKPKSSSELKNLLLRGDSLDRLGRTPSAFADSLHINPPEG
jgi:hypothetical protein